MVNFSGIDEAYVAVSGRDRMILADIRDFFPMASGADLEECVEKLCPLGLCAALAKELTEAIDSLAERLATLPSPQRLFNPGRRIRIVQRKVAH